MKKFSTELSKNYSVIVLNLKEEKIIMFKFINEMITIIITMLSKVSIMLLWTLKSVKLKNNESLNSFYLRVLKFKILQKSILKSFLCVIISMLLKQSSEIKLLKFLK